mgnify:CR=1 FL=1|jgi:predicted RNA-binding Zn-ribbon protein involved in translation (DUF1610 family)
MLQIENPVKSACPNCGGTDFATTRPSPYFFLFQTEIKETGKCNTSIDAGLPVVAAVCSRCGLIQLFHSEKLSK